MNNVTIIKDSNDEYHAKDDYLGSSMLKEIKRSPLHFKEKVFKTTEALEFGSAYHMFILEPDLFKKEYFIYNQQERPDQTKNMNATVNKEWKREIEMTYKNVLPKEIYQVMKDMKARLFQYPYAAWLLTKGDNEKSHYLEMNGVKCKFRPDSQHDKKRVIADLKTVADASHDGFMKYVNNFDAHIQAAFYVDCYEQCYPGERIPQFYWVAQEKTIPYAINIFKASHQLLSVGTYEYEILMEQFKYCQETGEYKGYEVFANNKFGITELSLPNWKVKELNFYNQF